MKIGRIDIYLYIYCEVNKDKLIGARMSFFEIKSENRIDSYMDSSKHVAQMNPVIADAYGSFPKIFIEKPYRVAIHDMHDELVFEDEYEVMEKLDD